MAAARFKTLLDVPPHLRAKFRELFEPKKVTPEAAAALRREMLKAERDKLVNAFTQQLTAANIARLFQREYLFHVERKWALDFFARCYNIGVELHGGVNESKARGRHLRAKGYENDRTKMNAAQEAGIRVFEYTSRAIASGEAIEQIERVIAQRAAR